MSRDIRIRFKAIPIDISEDGKGLTELAFDDDVKRIFEETLNGIRNSRETIKKAIENASKLPSGTSFLIASDNEGFKHVLKSIEIELAHKMAELEMYLDSKELNKSVSEITRGYIPESSSEEESNES